MTPHRSPRLFLVAFAVASIVWFATASTGRADDTIAAETVSLVKKASVYLRVEGGLLPSSGSGFVISADDKAVLIATNNHVIATPPVSNRPGVKPVTIRAVFDSGTSTEKSYPAEIVARDRDKDLAVIRVNGVKNPPKPIAFQNPPAAFETMTVYTFGFPFGKALSVDRGFPAITVGKATVSSLRKGPDGELAYIQIDGNLNPGNSGGPMVDAKGRLIGIAVMIIRDGQGIGLTIPAIELERMMAGAFGRVKVTPKKADAGTVIRVEVELIDPTGAIREANVNYLLLDPKGKRPESGAFDKHPDGKKLALKIDGAMAAAELKLPTDGEVMMRVSATPAGRTVATKLRSYHLKSLLVAAGLAGPPPEGWKQYMPDDRTFSLWVPQQPKEQSWRSRTTSVNSLRLRTNSLHGQFASGLRYEAEMLELPDIFGPLPEEALDELFLEAAVEPGGKETDTQEVMAGTVSGTEHVIQNAKGVTRARIFVKGSTGFVVMVSGEAGITSSAEAEMFLASFRPLAAPGKAPVVVAKNPSVGPAPGPTRSATDKTPLVLGNAFGPEFKDMAPEGGFLVGFEIGLSKSFGRDMIRAIKPIFRVGDKESTGKEHGKDWKKPVTLKAKPGYAVGAISAKHFLFFDGMSVTFMKIVDGKLDPKDSYESEFVGSDEEKPTEKVSGNGTPVLGIVGRSNDRDLIGFGLVFKGQEANEASSPRPMGKGPANKGAAGFRIPRLLGGGLDPEFKETAPEGGLLVGFEVGLVKESGHDTIRAIKPIYRVGEKETTGKLHGTQVKNLVTVKAKPGYAVGAISVKYGQNFDGMSVTFMKIISDDRLELKDRYDSDFVGSDEEKPTQRIGGNGTPVLGIVGKSNDKDLTGMGLLFKGQEGYEPKK